MDLHRLARRARRPRRDPAEQIAFHEEYARTDAAPSLLADGAHDEIQRTLIAERILGLPKEVRA